MTEEQFQAEKEYMMASDIAKGLLKRGLLTEEEYTQIDTILLEKYRPLFGTLFSDNACYLPRKE